jgi:hypothetical protein
MPKYNATALAQGRLRRSVPLTLGFILSLQVLVLAWLPIAQAQGNSFAVATRYGEIICSSALAEDRKSLEVSCAGRDGVVVSAYRQMGDGTIQVVLEIGKVGEAVTLAILNSQDKG